MFAYKAPGHTMTAAIPRPRRAFVQALLAVLALGLGLLVESGVSALLNWVSNSVAIRASMAAGRRRVTAILGLLPVMVFNVSGRLWLGRHGLRGIWNAPSSPVFSDH